MKIYHNPRCSKSRQTLNLIKEKGAEVEIIEYPKHPDKFSFMKGLQLKNKAEFYIPEEILEQLEALNIIPIIENDEIQLIMPFTVSVD